jgi:two-component system response regulator
MLRKTILLVEDNPDDEELTLLAFEDCQIANQVIVKRDGAEALDYLLGRGIYSDRHLYPMPSLVLLDLKLPKVDGLEVLRCLRSDTRTKILPIIILTTSEEEQDLLNSYSLGCNSYIRKPVDFEQFMQAVRQLGVYWLLLNETPRM